MKVWLIVCASLIASCSVLTTNTVPDVTRAFDDYPEPVSRQTDPIELPTLAAHGTTTIDGQEYVLLTGDQFTSLEQYQAAAESNTEALQELSIARQAMVDEIKALVRAGAQAEKQAEIFRQLYVNEINDARLQKLLTSGGLALLLILFGVGKL